MYLWAQFTKTVLLIVIGLALFAFIAGDAWKVLQPHQGKQEVGEINGKSISAQDYQKMVDEYSEIIKLTQGVNALNDEQLTQVKDQVWSTFVNNELISAEAKKLGLTVTDAEIESIIDEGTHPLLLQTPFRNQQTGAFDKDMLKQFLVEYANIGKNTQLPAQYVEYYQRMGSFWKFVERMLRESTLSEKYQNLITRSLISNSVETELSFKGRTEESDVLLAALPFSVIPDSTVNVTKDEIQNLYNQRKETFKQPFETRDFQYIDVTVLPSDEDRAEVLKEVQEYVPQLSNPETDLSTFIRSTGSSFPFSAIALNKNVLPTDVNARLDSVSVGETFGPYYNQADDSYNAFRVLSKVSSPDSIQFRQLQIAMETEDKTKTLADSIFTALKGGADFATLAKNYAQNEESTWLDTRSFEGASLNTENSDLLNSLIRANVNEWNMMKLGQGYILTQVLAKKAYQEKYNIAVIKRPVEFSKETYNKAYNDFSQFVAQNTKKEDVVKNAEENGYRLLERADFSSAEHYVGGVHNTREIVKWIFDAKEGDVSPLFECGDNNHMMVVVLDRINKAGYRNINLVADMLRSEIVRDKKAEQIMAKYGDFAKLSGAEDALTDTIKHITFSAPVYVSKTRASEPVLSALASKTEVNQISPLVKGNAAVYAMQVLSRNNGTETYDEKTESTTVRATASRFASMFINDLYDKAKVKDTRYLFF